MKTIAELYRIRNKMLSNIDLIQAQLNSRADTGKKHIRAIAMRDIEYFTAEINQINSLIDKIVEIKYKCYTLNIPTHCNELKLKI